MKKYFIFIVMVIFAISCAKDYSLDPLSMSVGANDTEIAMVNDDCKHLYQNEKWKIAVVEFTNNTGYSDMEVKNTSSHTKGVARTVGVGASVTDRNRGGNSVTVGVGASKTNFQYSTDSNEFMGQFAPSLGPFAQSITEETISQIGGVTIINRSHLDKILQEQQFQMTLADPNTVIEFGQLAGVKYIFTGSVDNIQAKYTAPSNVRINDGSGLGAILTTLSAGFDIAASGWHVSAKITLNLIDAETGRVVFSKSFNNKARATQSANFQPDIIINTAKKIMSESVKNAGNDFIKLFEMKGYINEIKGNKKIAHINLGSDDGLKVGNVLNIYSVHETVDFLSNAKKCQLVKLNAKLIISDQVTNNGSWAFIEGKKEVLDDVKIGSIVIRDLEK